MRRIFLPGEHLTSHREIDLEASIISGGDIMETNVSYLLYLMGFFFSFYLGYQSFHKRWVTIGDIPTFPRYLTCQFLYQCGVYGYGFISGLFFIIVIVYWVPLRPLVSAVLGKFGTDVIVKQLTAEAALAPIGAMAVVLFLLKWDSSYNPLQIVQNMIQEFVAFPRKANEVHSRLINANLMKKYKDQPESDTGSTGQTAKKDAYKSREVIIQDLDIGHSLQTGDFNKNQRTIEYHWAKACTIFYEVESERRRDSSFKQFFVDKSLGWAEISEMHKTISEKVEKWKKSEPDYVASMELMQTLQALITRLYWLLTFLIIFGSNSEDTLWDRVERYDPKSKAHVLVSPGRKIAVIGICVGLATLIGHELGVLICRSTLQIEIPPPYFSIDALDWLFFAMAGIWIPTAIVIFIRCRSSRIMPFGENKYWGFYITTFLFSYVLSIGAFVGVHWVLSFFVPERPFFSPKQELALFAPWGIFPALIASYCSYSIDHNCRFPRNETQKNAMLQCIMNSILFAAFSTLIGFFATATKPLPSRIVILTTLFSILLSVPLLLKFEMKHSKENIMAPLDPFPEIPTKAINSAV